MPIYIALLRAVNVGGTGKLPMAELVEICGEAGCKNVQTYIASGNVVFDSKASPSKVKAELERRLHAHMGKPVGVIVRTVSEMKAVLKANPFPKAESKFNIVIFLDEAPPRDALKHVAGQTNEKIRLGNREIFVHYGSGMGRSKLKIPAAKTGTARNMNTVAKLVEMAEGR
jgi:uncharacterized protein (DUF1697 family)